MSTNGFLINEEEVMLHHWQEEAVQMSNKGEEIVQSSLSDGVDRGSIMIFGPQLDEQIGRWIAIGRSLFRAYDVIPRLLKMNGSSVPVKKVTPSGVCSSLSSIVKCLIATDKTPVPLHENLLTYIISKRAKIYVRDAHYIIRTSSMFLLVENKEQVCRQRGRFQWLSGRTPIRSQRR